MLIAPSSTQKLNKFGNVLGFCTSIWTKTLIIKGAATVYLLVSNFRVAAAAAHSMIIISLIRLVLQRNTMQWRETKEWWLSQPSIAAHSATWFFYSYGSYSLSIIATLFLFLILNSCIFFCFENLIEGSYGGSALSQCAFSSSLPSEIEWRSDLNSKSVPAFCLDLLL